MSGIDWEEIAKAAYYAYRLKLKRSAQCSQVLPLWQDLPDCQQVGWILGARAGLKVFDIQKRNAERDM